MNLSLHNQGILSSKFSIHPDTYWKSILELWNINLTAIDIDDNIRRADGYCQTDFFLINYCDLEDTDHIATEPEIDA